VAALAARGVAREHIHADRFTTSADTAPPAGLLHYAKFFSFHAVGLIAAAALAAGGAWIPFALLATLAFYFVGDALGGDDTSTPTFRHPRVLTAQLWLALPLLATIVFLSVWREGVAAWLLTGLMIGMVGTIPAHELTHRTWDPVSMAIGRWLLAFSFDTPFAIEHVYVHHRYVSTTEDPATAPRGRNAYAHVVISTLRGYASAWRIEAQRLARRRLPLFSRHNVFLRGQLMSLALVAIAAAIGGVAGMAYFAACALMGKALLEVVN
jgi:alkane 1-monooxygenase